MSEQSPTPAPPAIPEPAELGPNETALAEFVHPRVRRSRGFVHSFFSEAFDADEAPLLKQFVRLDADLTTLWITCCAVIGNEQPGHSPYVEEWVAVPLEPARAAMATARAQAAPSP
jgi:hypothetical protein